MFQEYFTKDLNELPVIFIGVLITYLMIMVFTKIFGLKSFAKMTGFDFINTIAIGNILAMSIATSNPTVLSGIILIGLLYLMNYCISYLTFKYKAFRNKISNSPILLMRDGKLLRSNMKKTKITLNELRGKLREANVIRLCEVKAVVLETTGDVSVLHTSGSEDLEDFLLEDVEI